MTQLEHLLIPSVLNRAGRWMTSAEIFAAAPEYSAEHQVADDLERLAQRRAVAVRPGSRTRLPKFGLPGWRR